MKLEKNAETLLQILHNIAEHLEKPALSLANYILKDKRFPVWSGSSYPHQHHYGTGGLITHTMEVVNLCLIMQDNYSATRYDINRTSLFLAALFHDCGKMYDYVPLGTSFDCTQIFNNLDSPVSIAWGSSPHKRLIHHISRSAIEWSLAVSKEPSVTTEMQEEVLHAILSHHGTRIWGSPVAPKTRIAWIVHLCDNLSARMYDADTLDIVKEKPSKDQ